MKVLSTALATFCFLGQTTAFSPIHGQSNSNSPLNPNGNAPLQPVEHAGLGQSSFASDVNAGTAGFQMFPPDNEFKIETIMGGGTVRTWKLPPWADRVQYMIMTQGRPLKATVELWLGPLRRTHMLEMDFMDGAQTPYRATLKFKNSTGAQMLRIRTSEHPHLPVICGLALPSPERAAALAANTEAIWAEAPKQLCQGGAVQGGPGTVRTFNGPANVASVQVLFWAVDTGKKSMKAQIEVLQGPNNPRQVIQMQCGGGSQPYHGVIQTPGDGWIIRIVNKKFVEDGLFQCAVVPYETTEQGGEGPDTQWWDIN